MNMNNNVNANSQVDAFKQLLKYATMLSEAKDNLPSNFSLDQSAPSYSEMEKEALLKEALATDTGRIALGQAMANPIRRNLDYQGVGRKALIVDPLPPGAIAVYDKDIDVSATIISSNGAAPESRVFGDRVSVPEFEVVSYPTVRIAEVRRRRFNVIDRAQQKARQEIQAQEDANIFAALDFASTQENTQTSITAGIEVPDLIQLKKQIDRWDLLTTKFFMNIEEFTDILGWYSHNAGGYGVDMVTQREILNSGLYARIFGADIIVSKIVPKGTVFAMSDPEFVGVMPVRQDIEVLPADEPRQLKLGWVVNEIIGVGIVNGRAVASGLKTGSYTGGTSM
jgi:hypothetical protein